MLRGKPFWLSSLDRLPKLLKGLLVELFWSLQVYGNKNSKTLMKRHEYSRLFSRKAPTKKAST